MQGTFIGGTRPRTKKALKEAVLNEPDKVRIEGTSLVGPRDFDGWLKDAPAGSYAIVGPDPHTARNWYATIKVAPSGSITVT